MNIVDTIFSVLLAVWIGELIGDITQIRLQSYLVVFPVFLIAWQLHNFRKKPNRQGSSFWVIITIPTLLFTSFIDQVFKRPDMPLLFFISSPGTWFSTIIVIVWFLFIKYDEEK